MKKSKNRRDHKKKKLRKKEKRSNMNSILSYVKHTFFILDNWIEPQAFKHTHCTFEKNVSFNVKKGPIQGSICFKLVPELLVPGPLSKVTLSTRVLLQFFSHSLPFATFFSPWQSQTLLSPCFGHAMRPLVHAT